MSWLKDKLRNWLLQKDYEEDSIECNTIKPARPRVGLSSSRTFDSRGMGFIIYQAVGGNIMEYNFYDEKNDRHDHRLHIIPADQELGQGIAHIITYEMLRK